LTLVFFTDRDLGTAFPEILKRAGFAVERHRDHFLPDCPDEDWLAEVGKRQWVALTHDTRIRYKPNELAAVIRHGLRLLVIVGKVPFPELNPAASGRIERWYPK
jgi:PIN like domain